MSKRIIIATAIGCLLGRPDVVSQLTLGPMAAAVCAAPCWSSLDLHS